MQATFDHLVLNVQDTRRALDFYAEVLGLCPENLAAWERGEFPFASVRLDERAVLDFFPPPMWEGGPHRPATQQRVHHFSIVVAEADWPALEARLSAADVPLETPRRLWGGHGFGLSWMVPDPDGNEVELRVYPKGLARELHFSLHAELERVDEARFASLCARALRDSASSSPSLSLSLSLSAFAQGSQVAFALANDELIGAARRPAAGPQTLEPDLILDPLFRGLGIDDQLRERLAP